VQLVFRTPKPTDLNFITSTFAKSIKSDSSLGRSCLSTVFFSEFPKVIDHILSKSNILIACDNDQEDAILGYIIHEPNIIHYAYVKSALRNLGIFKRMINIVIEDKKNMYFSFNTKSSKAISNKLPQLIFNPFFNYKKEVSE
jgi:hypothetical protein